MKIFAVAASLSLASFGLASCNAPSGAITVAAETACSVVETAYGMVGALPLNAVESLSLNGAEAICKATGDGANLTAQTDTTAILSAVVMLEPILANIHIHSAKISHMRAQIRQLRSMAH